MAIIGGTFSVYSSAMKLSHKNSDLTPLSILISIITCIKLRNHATIIETIYTPQDEQTKRGIGRRVGEDDFGIGWVGYV